MILILKNINENELLNDCKTNVILKSILAGRIAINASRQGIKDEVMQFETINITKLSHNLYRPTKSGEILI